LPVRRGGKLVDKLTTSPIPEWELWACAHELIRQHGEEAPAIAAKRAGELEREGAGQGEATWRLILHRIEQLQAGPDGQPN
jgi:hypothetical protein